MTGAIMQREPCSPSAKRDGGAIRRLRRPERHILSEAIAVFFIGRDSEGFWVARDADRPIGGLFLLRSSALAFARSNCEPQGCAFVFETDRFELDVDNRGNRFAGQIGRLKRVIKNIGRRSGCRPPSPSIVRRQSRSSPAENQRQGLSLQEQAGPSCRRSSVVGEIVGRVGVATRSYR